MAINSSSPSNWIHNSEWKFNSGNKKYILNRLTWTDAISNYLKSTTGSSASRALKNRSAFECKSSSSKWLRCQNITRIISHNSNLSSRSRSISSSHKKISSLSITITILFQIIVNRMMGSSSNWMTMTSWIMNPK